MEISADRIDSTWPTRSWLLALLGALIGLAIQQLGDLPDKDWEWGRRLVSALMVFLGVGGMAFALAWQKGRTLAAALIAVGCGLVSGGVMIWNGAPQDWSGEGPWPMVCSLFTACFLLTIFQAGQDRAVPFPAEWTLAGLRTWKREAFAYEDVHRHIWTDALLLGAAALFAGIAFGIAHLLAAMFMLVKLDFLRELLRLHWAAAMLAGSAFGAGLGLLRDRASIMSAMQRVAMLVLRVLAPALAVGLVAFLAVLPFTGLDPLWATGNTTPLMLSGGVIALFLINAVIGDGAEDEARALPLRWGAAALAVALVPLIAIAAWSTGLRIGQHGLSPDRLWALTFVVVASVTAVAYAMAVLRRKGWAGRLRGSNLDLAFLFGGVAFLLSTSIIGFERIATADQMARLQSGKVSAVDFDYKGLWFDFGPSGKSAIRALAKSGKSADIRRYAAEAMKLDGRWAETSAELAVQNGRALDKRLTILPRAVPLEAGLRERLTDYVACGREQACLLRYVPGEDHAIAAQLPDKTCTDCGPSIALLYRSGNEWQVVQRDNLPGRLTITTSDNREAQAKDLPEQGKRWLDAFRAGRVELRTVERRQLFIDGEPYGETIPMENAAEP